MPETMPEAAVSAAGLRIVKLLVGTPPKTVADMIDATGVTRTAVTEQLNELVAGGFVRKTTERLRGRGRPRHLYAATDAALTLLFASNQRFVVPAMWRAIEESGGPKLVRQIVTKVGRMLAEHYGHRIKSQKPRQRLREMTALLSEEGGLVEAVEKDGHLVLYKRSCPFIAMLDEHQSICCVDQEMMSAVVGQPVRRTACRHEGAPCCTFEIVQET
jgi:DeoR family transcriptional regulator, suf operon transcriptional repressor